MGTKRFVVNNALRIVDFLHGTGLDPNAALLPPSKSLNGGCTDSDHCEQHPGTHHGQQMLSIKTELSGNKLHKIHRAINCNDLDAIIKVFRMTGVIPACKA